jgi:hypothetical protein
MYTRIPTLAVVLLAAGTLLHGSAEHRQPARAQASHPASPVPASGPSLLPFDEFLVDTTVELGPRQADQFQPAVAFDGTSFLVVWYDGGEIVAARIRRDGLVLDPFGITLGWGSGEECPSVVFDGVDYFAVWSYDSRILGCRVSTSGQVLDPNAIVVCSTATLDSRCSIAWSGTDGFVVWTDPGGGVYSDVHGSRVTRDGEVRDLQGLPVCTAYGMQMSPAVAFDGRNYFAVWEDYRNGQTPDIYGVRVDTSGQVLDSAGFAVSLGASAQFTPSLAFGDSVFLVVWADMRIDPNQDVYCARVTPDARVLDSAGVVVSDAAGYQVLPKVAFDGANFMLDWVDWRSGVSDIYGARVTQLGVLLDTAGIAICPAQDYQGDPGIAFDDSNYLAVWHDYRGGGYSEIFAVRVTPDGHVLDTADFLVSTGWVWDQHAPSAAFLGSSYVVAWEQDGEPTGISFSRLAPDGSLLDSAPRRLCPSSGNRYLPAVAAAESCALIAWIDESLDGVGGARVTQSGVILDSAAIRIMTGRGNPDLVSAAGSGEGWLAVWEEWGDSACDVRGARVNLAGVVLDTTPILIFGQNESQLEARVAAGDSGWLVVWNDERFNPRRIYACRVTRSGGVLDSTGIRVTLDSSQRYAPQVASSDDGYLVVWEDRLQPSAPHDVCGVRLDRNGVVLDSQPILISSGIASCRNPSVTFDGNDYIVAWFVVNSGSVIGARVSRWGTVLATFPVSQRAVSQQGHFLASGPGQQVLALYSAHADSVNHRAIECQRIWGRLSPFGSVEENPPQVAPRMTLDVLPNPLSGVGEVRYALPVSGRVRLGVFDIAGREVCTLADGTQKAGRYSVRWNGASASGRSLANGVYFIRLCAGGRTETRAVSIVR